MGIDELEKLWNAQADKMNQWEELGLDEIIDFAQKFGDWKPIESAPHDRQLLLYKDGGDMHVGRWVKNPYTGDEAFAIAELGEHGRAIVHPTHWAELPLPPNAYSVTKCHLIQQSNPAWTSPSKKTPTRNQVFSGFCRLVLRPNLTVFTFGSEVSDGQILARCGGCDKRR